MVEQLLWVEMLCKLAAGCALLMAPTTTAAVMGWPRPGAAFWPRLLGALLIGIGLASALDARAAGGRGLGLGGSVSINLAVATFLLVSVMLRPPAARRGRLLSWLIVGCLFLLSLIEIALAG
ncbi:MAG TPA: hypothetical protein VFR00_00185 [Hyphomicrobiaceae bacterium]|jgi:hypothetical protein|nr:hypothetical protein [Hyphomicrobiaceae bacterium]